MAQPSTSPAPPAESASPAPTATEIVTRPDPGIARGRWEAPAWVFWVLLAAIVLATAAYVLRRLGFLRLGGANGSAPPPSSTSIRRP